MESLSCVASLEPDLSISVRGVSPDPESRFSVCEVSILSLIEVSVSLSLLWTVLGGPPAVGIGSSGLISAIDLTGRGFSSIASSVSSLIPGNLYSSTLAVADRRI